MSGRGTAPGRAARIAAYAALPLLYLLRNDLWFWDDPSRLLGLPVGLSYHILFSAAVVLVMWFLVRVAWPGDALERLAGAGAPAAENGGAGDPGDHGGRAAGTARTEEAG